MNPIDEEPADEELTDEQMALADALLEAEVFVGEDGVWLISDALDDGDSDGNGYTYTWDAIIERTVALWTGDRPVDIPDNNQMKAAIAEALRAAALRIEQAIDPQDPER